MPAHTPPGSLVGHQEGYPLPRALSLTSRGKGTASHPCVALSLSLSPPAGELLPAAAAAAAAVTAAAARVLSKAVAAAL